MNNDIFSEDAYSQFVLSYELLQLLQWLGRYDVEKLKKLITRAVAHGLHDEIQRNDKVSEQNAMQDMHHSMIDFFELLDGLLFEAINDHVETKARQKNLLATVDQIDSSMCDDETVRLSIEKTTKTLDHHPHMNPQEQLYKELLKKWKPLDKNVFN